MIGPSAVAAPTPSRRRLPPWGVIVAIWTVFGLLLSTQQWVGYTLRGNPLPWRTLLLVWMPVAYAWAIVTPGILWLGRRFPFERGVWARSAAVHLVACSALVFLLGLGYTWHSARILPTPASDTAPLARVLQLFVAWLFTDGLLYWTVLSVGYVVAHQRRLRERELKASQLETQLVRADLQALKMQLQPHFLFNALHTIGALVRTGDRDTAIRVLAGLGDLLRRVLDGGTRQEVPLEQELEFVRAYLAIEKVRFRDRLVVSIDAPDEVRDAEVPHLILQPLVENAIRHGIAPHLDAGRLEVRARRAGTRLDLTVRDDGPGLPDASAPASAGGIGLANARARLERLYGADFDLTIGNAAGGGLEARVSLPFRRVAAEWVGTR
jgi:two-component system, LytTR family, sensor kinase